MDLALRGHLAMADRYAAGSQTSVPVAGGLLYAGATDFPVMANGAVPLDGDAAPLVDAARDFFSERGRGFTWFARSPEEDGLARAAGWNVVLERYPAMVLRAPVDLAAVPSGVQLRRVASEADARDYLVAADAAFVTLGLPSGVLLQLDPGSFLVDGTAAFVAYEGDRAVAVASVVMARGIGGIQWVGVLEEARGRGLAALVTGAAANAAFSDLGADYAWLEASHMGEPVYVRMGFEEVFSYRLWLAPPP
jgi:ribosomal protein S18 acetylase RimI-like enzyme